jgi:hypothetical protein
MTDTELPVRAGNRGPEKRPPVRVGGGVKMRRGRRQSGARTPRAAAIKARDGGRRAAGVANRTRAGAGVSTESTPSRYRSTIRAHGLLPSRGLGAPRAPCGSVRVAWCCPDCASSDL